MLFVNRQNFTSFLLTWVPFAPLSCLMALAKISSTVLNKSDYSVDFCLIPDFRVKNFSFPTLSMMLIAAFSYMAFITWSYILFIPSSLIILLWKCAEFCQMLFLHLLIIWILPFVPLIWCNTLIELPVLNHPCILGINPTWSWCMILAICCELDLLVLCWIFCIYIHQQHQPIIFLSGPFLALVSRL